MKFSRSAWCISLRFLIYATGVLLVNASTVSAASLQALVSFDDTNGANPRSQLVEDSNSNLFGTTVDGGADGDGTVFEYTAAGRLQTLVSL